MVELTLLIHLNIHNPARNFRNIGFNRTGQCTGCIGFQDSIYQPSFVELTSDLPQVPQKWRPLIAQACQGRLWFPACQIPNPVNYRPCLQLSALNPVVSAQTYIDQDSRLWQRASALQITIGLQILISQHVFRGQTKGCKMQQFLWESWCDLWTPHVHPSGNWWGRKWAAIRRW